MNPAAATSARGHMSLVEIRGIRVEVDRARTRAAYETIAAGAAEACDCAFCRNFRALGTAAFPDSVLEFFRRAEIDVRLPAETYQYDETAPGKHLYGGEYYFFGSAPIDDGSALDASGAFSFTFTHPSPLAQDEFQAEGAVCFSFVVELPWVIADAL